VNYPEIAHYVVHFHSHLMTEPEVKAQCHLFATLKATMGRIDEAAQRESQKVAAPHCEAMPPPWT
jgi:hypothetical protein